MGNAVRKNELRRSARFHIDDTVTQVYRRTLLSALGIGRLNEACAAVNLSEGGILISSRDRLGSGTRVSVRLDIGRFQDVIEAEGVVRWCFQGAGDDAGYFAGIRFTKVPPAAVVKIVGLRGYFTSPEYRRRSAARRRDDPLGLGRTA
jgi:PilZ domain